MRKKSKARFVAEGGLIAAAYVVLTFASSAVGLASGAVQIRLSEALCILPCFTFSAVPGLFVGCLIANLITGSAVWDVIFGSAATLIGAFATYLLRKNRFLASIPPVVSNMLIVPAVLVFAYHIETAFPLLVLSVGAGELISAGLLGQLLYSALNKHRGIFMH